MRVRHLRYAELLPAPWKNGGGVTREIAIGPQGAGFAGPFAWRLSIAEVASDGPFSIFPEIDRTLTILGGAGVKLDFAEGEDLVIDLPGRPVRFDGGRACEGKLIAGPVTDFNVMTRRGLATHRVRRVTLGEETLAEVLENEVTALLLLKGQVTAEVGGERLALAPLDTLLVERGAAEMPGWRLVCGGSAVALLVEIDLTPGGRR